MKTDSTRNNWTQLETILYLLVEAESKACGRMHTAVSLFGALALGATLRTENSRLNTT